MPKHEKEVQVAKHSRRNICVQKIRTETGHTVLAIPSWKECGGHQILDWTYKLEEPAGAKQLGVAIRLVEEEAGRPVVPRSV